MFISGGSNECVSQFEFFKYMYACHKVSTALKYVLEAFIVAPSATFDT